MKPDPILEELWRIKDDLAREAGYDVHRLCENVRRWAAEHPHTGPMVKTDEEPLHSRDESLVLREEPPESRDEEGLRPCP